MPEKEILQIGKKTLKQVEKNQREELEEKSKEEPEVIKLTEVSLELKKEQEEHERKLQAGEVTVEKTDFNKMITDRNVKKRMEEIKDMKMPPAKKPAGRPATKEKEPEKLELDIELVDLEIRDNEYILLRRYLPKRHDPRGFKPRYKAVIKEY